MRAAPCDGDFHLDAPTRCRSGLVQGPHRRRHALGIRFRLHLRSPSIESLRTFGVSSGFPEVRRQSVFSHHSLRLVRQLLHGGDITMVGCPAGKASPKTSGSDHLPGRPESASPAGVGSNVARWQPSQFPTPSSRSFRTDDARDRNPPSGSVAISSLRQTVRSKQVGKSHEVFYRASEAPKMGQSWTRSRNSALRETLRAFRHLPTGMRNRPRSPSFRSRIAGSKQMAAHPFCPCLLSNSPARRATLFPVRWPDGRAPTVGVRKVRAPRRHGAG